MTTLYIYIYILLCWTCAAARRLFAVERGGTLGALIPQRQSNSSTSYCSARANAKKRTATSSSSGSAGEAGRAPPTSVAACTHPTFKESTSSKQAGKGKRKRADVN